MSIFAVLADPSNTVLESTIKFQFPDDHLTIRPGQFLVAAKSTAKDLSNQLIPEGQSGIVLTVSSYFGRANPAIWEWIKTKWSENGG
jgi:hypothetical protein